MEILLYGLVQSASLLLMALGFSLVYGISRVPNFAHGAIYVFTGWMAWVFVERLGLPFVAAALLALAAAAVLGLVIYRLVVERIRGMEISEVIATYAVGLAILEGLRWAGLRGSTYTLPGLGPGFAGDVIHIAGVPLDYQRVAVLVIAVLVVAALTLATRYTRLGLALRAVAQDERAAMMLGIDADRTGMVAMALGSVVAGVGALVLFPLGTIVVQEGYKVLIYALAVCVLGGLGSWLGTVLASLVLGFSLVLTVAHGKPHYQMVVMSIAIIATFLVRPSGLCGRQDEIEDRV